MGTVALVARAGGQPTVDPAVQLRANGDPHTSTERREQKHERFDVPFEHFFLLHPGSLLLVPTLEWIKIPPDLQGVVTARSSWAREGLNIATATIINPGYQGIVTLELANFGEVPIKLYPGLRIAQITFYDFHSCNPVADKAHLDRSQFKMCFEPQAGKIADGDEKFLRSQLSP
jgi:dCTP deaminase